MMRRPLAVVTSLAASAARGAAASAMRIAGTTRRDKSIRPRELDVQELGRQMPAPMAPLDISIHRGRGRAMPGFDPCCLTPSKFPSDRLVSAGKERGLKTSVVP